MISFYFLYSLMPWTMLFLRIALGAIFLVHGMPKVKMAQQIAPMMEMSAGMVILIGLVEILGAIAVLIGLFTTLGSLGMAAIMVGAMHYKINKWHAPFTAMDKMGWEYDLILLAAALMLATTGAGPLSIDAMLGMW